MVSTHKEQQDFINNIVIPFCYGSVNQENRFVVYDLEGKIIIASNMLAQSLGYKDWSELKGKTDRELNLAPDNEEVYNEWDKLRNRVINEEISIYYINFLKYAYGFDTYAHVVFPLFMPNGEAIGTRCFSTKFNWLVPEKCFTEFSNLPIKPVDKIGNDYSLTEREYEIIFAIYIGLTQEEAALFLKMSRSNLAKILNQRIYPKFNLQENNIEYLVKKLSEHHLITHIPQSFMQSKCIVIDDYDLDF